MPKIEIFGRTYQGFWRDWAYDVIGCGIFGGLLTSSFTITPKIAGARFGGYTLPVSKG